MKYILIFILQLFFVNMQGQCDQIDNWNKSLFDPACCDYFSELSQDPTTQTELVKKFYESKCLVWNKEFLKAIRNVENLTDEIKVQIEYPDFEKQSINDLYFQTLLLGFELSKISLNRHQREKYQNEINRLICDDERLLIEHIERFIFNKPNLKFKTEDVLSHFDFYLSYNSLENCDQKKAEEFLKSLLNRVGYGEILFKPQTDEFANRNFLSHGSSLSIEVYFRDLKYVIFAPKTITRETLIIKEYECDTITIFDYYPLERWKEPIFLSYYKKEKEDTIFNDLVQSINLMKVIEQ